MNILVTGANGQLGHEMQICAKKSNHKFVFTDVAEGYEKLDITNLDAIREKVKENDIQVIVNCAAYTNVDKAETDFDLANLLNNTAAGNLAQAMKEVDGTLIHVSTDYVFQGDKNIPRDILIALEHIVGRYMNQSTIYLLHCLSQVTCSGIVQQISQIEISLCLIYIGISSAVNNYLNIVFLHLFADCVKVSDIQFLIAFSNISEDKLVITLFGANLHFMAQLTISACY